MAQDHRQQARRIFMDVADLRESDRAAALERTCGGDAQLRAEVEALLSANGQAGGFMKSPTSDNGDASMLATARISKHLQLDLAPEQFIVIGDTPNDIACARHFGAKALAVGTGRLYQTAQLLECKPDAFIPDLSNLELVMQTLASL